MWLFGIVLSKLWPFIWESRDLQKFTFSSYREKNMMLQLCLLLIDRIKSCGYQQPDDAMFSRKTWQIGSSLLALLWDAHLLWWWLKLVPNRHMAEEMGWVTTLNSVGLLMDDDTTRFSLNGSQQVMMWGSGEGQPTPWLKALGRLKPHTYYHSDFWKIIYL